MSWLDELIVGSEVFLENRFNKEIKRVSRFTPKTIIVDDKYIFSRSNGRQKGSKVYDLLQLTPESKAEYLFEKEKVRKVRWVEYNINKIPKERLVDIYDFLHRD